MDLPCDRWLRCAHGRYLEWPSAKKSGSLPTASGVLLPSANRLKPCFNRLLGNYEAAPKTDIGYRAAFQSGIDTAARDPKDSRQLASCVGGTIATRPRPSFCCLYHLVPPKFIMYFDMSLNQE